MDINTALAPRYVAAARTDINAKHKPPELDQHKAEDPAGTGEKSLIDEIREKGFQAYAEEIAEKKKEELRAKILGEMGLDEEKLANMSPEVRAQIERMINAEIVKRMMAEGELSRQNKGQMVGVEITQAGEPLPAKIDAGGVGLGPLLALQEAERQADGKPAKKDEDAG